MNAKNIAVIGAGAVGGVAAATLVGLGHHVKLCVRRPLSRLLLESGDEMQETPVDFITDPAQASYAQWVLLTTKAQDTAGAASWFGNLVGPETMVAVLQNGIDHRERLSKYISIGQILPVIVYSPGEIIAPAHIRTHGPQRYIVPSTEAGVQFAALFEGGKIKVERCCDIQKAAWQKLLANITANPITALTLCRIGIMRDPDIRNFARTILLEAREVAQSVGTILSETEIDHFLDTFVELDPNGGTSMLYDRLAGRPLEHEFLTGTVVHLAQQNGIDVPLNSAVLTLLRGLQSSIA